MVMIEKQKVMITRVAVIYKIVDVTLQLFENESQERCVSLSALNYG